MRPVALQVGRPALGIEQQFHLRRRRIGMTTGSQADPFLDDSTFPGDRRLPAAAEVPPSDGQRARAARALRRCPPQSTLSPQRFDKYRRQLVTRNTKRAAGPRPFPIVVRQRGFTLGMLKSTFHKTYDARNAGYPDFDRQIAQWSVHRGGAERSRWGVSATRVGKAEPLPPAARISPDNLTHNARIRQVYTRSMHNADE